MYFFLLSFPPSFPSFLPLSLPPFLLSFLFFVFFFKVLDCSLEVQVSSSKSAFILTHVIEEGVKMQYLLANSTRLGQKKAYIKKIVEQLSVLNLQTLRQFKQLIAIGTLQSYIPQGELLEYATTTFFTLSVYVRIC